MKKICSKCHVEKPLTEFHNQKDGKFGKRPDCMICNRLIKKRYRDANKEKIAAQKKAYREANPEKVKALAKASYQRNKTNISLCNKLYKQKNKEACKERDKKYYEANKEKIMAQSKLYYESNKDEINAKGRAYYQRTKEVQAIKNKIYRRKNQDIIKARKKEYSIKNKDKLNAKYLERLKTNPQLKAAHALRGRINVALKSQETYKSESTMKLVGASIAFVKKWIESKFKPGMSWSNHGQGKGKWHIDHIIPCAAFDLTDIEQQKKCFHYSNLQPLWQEANLGKGARYNPD